MNISKFLGDNSYRLFVAVAFVGIINTPITIVNLFLLGKLTFPEISLPIQIPWVMVIGGGLFAGVLSLWILGYLLEYFGVPKAQNSIGNKNNLQMVEVLARLERIEKGLNEGTDHGHVYWKK